MTLAEKMRELSQTEDALGRVLDNVEKEIREQAVLGYTEGTVSVPNGVANQVIDWLEGNGFGVKKIKTHRTDLLEVSW